VHSGTIAGLFKTSQHVKPLHPAYVLGALLAVTVLGLSGCSSPGSTPRVTPGSPVQVHAKDGWLQGSVSRGVREFLGVPASHPVIDFRPAGNTVSAALFPAEHQCQFWATIQG
jgi:hypothetical protein